MSTDDDEAYIAARFAAMPESERAAICAALEGALQSGHDDHGRQCWMAGFMCAVDGKDPAEWDSALGPPHPWHEAHVEGHAAGVRWRGARAASG